MVTCPVKNACKTVTDCTASEAEEHIHNGRKASALCNHGKGSFTCNESGGGGEKGKDVIGMVPASRCPGGHSSLPKSVFSSEQLFAHLPG